MIRFNANLYRIATMCMSKEETRYYLCGVFVEPHPVKGVTLTATDGHKLLVIHDESGRADESAIVRLDVKLCKATRGMVREVQVETGSSEAAFAEALKGYTDDETNFQKVAAAYSVRVDGSFPDYRHVIPKAYGDAPAPAFASIHLLGMAAIGTELAAHFHDFNAKRSVSLVNRKDVMQIRAELDAPDGGPALVTWPACPAAFGVLMPVRWNDAAELPTWYATQSPMAQAAE